MNSLLSFKKYTPLLLSCVTAHIFGEEPSSQKGFVVSADFLAWFASEELGSIWTDVISIGDNASSWTAPSFTFNWDYGFRLNSGYDFAYDSWDTLLSWTWYRTAATHTVPFNSHVLSYSIHPEFFAGFLSGNASNSATAHWSLLFNMFDWELGRQFWISRSLSLRPFLGLKGGWIDQAIQIRYDDLTIDHQLTTNSGFEYLKNNFWGLGPLGGINTQWRVRDFGTHHFNFFGDFSIATLWGTWICADQYKNTIGQTSAITTKNSTLGALMFRGFLGIGWDVSFNQGRSHFTTKLGMEMQLWMNQLRLATLQLQRVHDDLTLQGITWNCRFDF